MQVEDIRVFIPSKSFDISRSFYRALGFELHEVNEGLTTFQSGNSTFFLQRYSNQELAENLMFQLIASDIEEAFSIISGIEGFDIKYEPIKN